MSPSRHVMIRASAGSGKTYALTQRVLDLLAAGAEPERIVALTFTRKAAGEFFDDILTRAAAVADDPAGLARLRRLIDAMPRLRLGTFDGFFGRIVRSFPFELGLTGDFELLQEHAARQERRRVLRRIFTRAQGGLAEAQKDFIEAFKRATIGVEEKRLAARLDGYLDAHHEVFLAATEEALWGDAGRIWPDGAFWRNAPSDRTPALRMLREWARAAPIEDKQRLRWLAFCDAVEAWRAGAPAPAPLTFVLKKALEALTDLERGPAVLKFDRKEQRLPATTAAALAAVTLAVVAEEFLRRIEMTRGIHALLRGYEQFYHDAVRRGGRLTFADIQRLLQPATLELKGGEERAADRLALDYRLDGGIDHWLLDEFQDTSFGQWSILRNLVDEAVQDAGGARTFFCVGDVKQAIYAWREGDHRLFGDILARYNGAAPGTIAERNLDASYRSGPPIVGLVNQVFGDAAVIAEHFPAAAAAEWNREWREHRSAVPERGGQAAVLLADDEAGRWRVALDVLLEADPIGRGLTCAVLVQKNDDAAALAEYLRQEGGIAAVADADLQVCVDQPVGAALLALFQAAAHPEDRFAWQHVRMTPLRAVLEGRGWAHPEQLTLGLLAEIQTDGFSATVARWVRALEPQLPADDAFSRERGRHMEAAAAAFDETGGRDVSEFVEFMERYSLREPESSAVVRVMTIHKAKGLGFDLVVLPDLEGQKLAQRREGLAVQRGANRQVEWILDLPPKDFWAQDPVLAAHVDAMEAAGCYEKLALLYVALTRAKRGLYVIVEPIGDSASKNYARLIAATLGAEPGTVAVGGKTFTGVWADGDSDWFLANAAAPDAPAAPLPEPAPARAGEARPQRRELRPRRPSGDQAVLRNLGALFGREAGRAAELGSAAHQLLATVEWADAGQRREIAAAWRGRDGADLAADCLCASELASVWERPAGNAEVWRERSFELVEGDEWISGMFDRVVVQRDAAGRAVAATVYDFKSDAAPDPKRHAEQMGWYRVAVQRLTGLPDAAVEGKLVWLARPLSSFTGGAAARTVDH